MMEKITQVCEGDQSTTLPKVKITQPVDMSSIKDTELYEEIKLSKKRYIVLLISCLLIMFSSVLHFNNSAYQISQIYGMSTDSIVNQTMIVFMVGALIGTLISIQLIDSYKCIMVVLVPSIVMFIGQILMLISLYTTVPNK